MAIRYITFKVSYPGEEHCWLSRANLDKSLKLSEFRLLPCRQEDSRQRVLHGLAVGLPEATSVKTVT